ncbi:hypothetical protein vBSlqSZDD2_52 [Serratia phage vB_SlqS_ZDD2]|nr:hypothetical protein vBSlqSZDD2_52 [Serratia phage vB_SlqS_ZDD2]
MSRARLFAVKMQGRTRYYAATRPGVLLWWHGAGKRWRYSNFEFPEDLVAYHGADCVRFLGMAKELKSTPKFGPLAK